ncbi:hypothetical protein I5R92_05960 [Pseudomonas carnis]|uniref:hypothetical protein n=1 Tax=Pseudomonas carnis TaxID=2487355 RepID=UPI0018D7F736|nr:hypothetical protein [Pseudomonas carnis]MBH3366825.1 hypothetical protein [Pseudomonas carnis]
MQWFPTPPTDNLYKFFAISGLLMLGGALFVIFALAYLDYRTERETDDSLYHFSSQQNQQQFRNRITAIKNLEPKKDLIAHLSDKLNNDLEFLTNALKVQTEIDVGYKARTPDTLDLVFDFVQARETFSLVAGLIYIVIAACLTVFGISCWRKKVQIPGERLNELDEEIKKASLLKLQLEIAQMQPMSDTVKRLFELGDLMRPAK